MTLIHEVEFDSDQVQLKFTAAAAEKAAELIKEQENQALNLRVYVEGGGCSGFQYGFSFDDAINSDDTVIERNGVKLLVDQASKQFLAGAEIDYVDDLNGAQFVINNPNAKTSCGCGSSFEPVC